MSTEHKCRLCSGSLTELFRLTTLGKYDVGYFKCSHCLSLQTETPYWLGEAYEEGHLSTIDTGAAQRTLYNLAASFNISKLIGARNVIDVGGGDGLLCRLLRDYNINCYVKDKYATPTYAQNFRDQDFDTPDLVTGFEILEHYPNPATELEDLFSHNPGAVLVSTDIYRNQQKDWWYLAPTSGQHVFFYSKTAIDMIAKKYKYRHITSGGFVLFIKQAPMITKFAAKILLSKIAVRLSRSFIMLLPSPGAWRDHSELVRKHRSTE